MWPTLFFSFCNSKLFPLLSFLHKFNESPIEVYDRSATFLFFSFSVQSDSVFPAGKEQRQTKKKVFPHLFSFFGPHKMPRYSILFFFSWVWEMFFQASEISRNWEKNGIIFPRGDLTTTHLFWNYSQVFFSLPMCVQLKAPRALCCYCTWIYGSSSHKDYFFPMTPIHAFTQELRRRGRKK